MDSTSIVEGGIVVSVWGIKRARVQAPSTVMRVRRALAVD